MEFYSWDDVVHAAANRWPEILKSKGIDYRSKQKNGPCPMCGGTDRGHFRHIDSRVLLYCRHCGTHWADDLVRNIAYGGDFARMCNDLGKELGVKPQDNGAIDMQETGVALKIQARHDAAEREKLRAKIIGSHPILNSLCGIADSIYAGHSGGKTFFSGIPAYQLYDYPECAAIQIMRGGALIDWLLIDGNGSEFLFNYSSVVSGSIITIEPEHNTSVYEFTCERFIDAMRIWEYYDREARVHCYIQHMNMNAGIKRAGSSGKTPVLAVRNDPALVFEAIQMDIRYIHSKTDGLYTPSDIKTPSAAIVGHYD